MDKTNLSLVHGVGKITAERLQASGVNTIPGLVRLSVAKIAEYTGFPPVRAALVRTAAAELLETAEPSTQAEATTPAVAKPAKAKKDKKAKKKPAKKDKKKKADKRSKKKRDNKKGKKKSKKKKK